jgi:hypothetical protein
MVPYEADVAVPSKVPTKGEAEPGGLVNDGYQPARGEHVAGKGRSSLGSCPRDSVGARLPL